MLPTRKTLDNKKFFEYNKEKTIFEVCMYIKRQKYLDRLISQKDKDIVKVITGIRRCGKSVLLFDIYYDYLLKRECY